MVKNKRVLAIVMAMMMVVSILPGLAFADTENVSREPYTRFQQSGTVKVYMMNCGTMETENPSVFTKDNDYTSRWDIEVNTSETAFFDNYITNTPDARENIEFVFSLGGTGMNKVDETSATVLKGIADHVKVVDANGIAQNMSFELRASKNSGSGGGTGNGPDRATDVIVTVPANTLEANTSYALVIYQGMDIANKGGLKANVSFKFTTAKKDFSGVVVSDIPDCDYTGTAITPTVEVKDVDEPLVQNTDYIVQYENNTEIGVATATIVGIGSYDGKITKTFNIVKVPVNALKLNKTSITLNEGKTATVKASVVPENATYKSVTYTSSNEKVAKVDANGKVTAVSAGTAKITAVANDESTVKATCTVTVKPVFAKLDVKATSKSYNSIKVTWTKDKKADGYVVYKYNSKTKKYVAVKNTATCSYTDTKLNTNQQYAYKVKAYRVLNGKKVYGSYSQKVIAKPIPATMNMTVKAKKGGKVTLQWDKVAGTTKYVVYKSTKKDSGYYKERITVQTKYTDTGLTKGKTYYYKARAYKVVNGKKVYGKYTKVFTVKAK